MKSKSTVRRAVDWFCGIEDATEEGPSKLSREEHLEQFYAIISLKQTKKAKIFLNVNAILLMTIGLFFIVFFSIGFDHVRNPRYFSWINN